MNRQIAMLHEVLPAELTGVNGGLNPALYSVALYGNPVPPLQVGPVNTLQASLASMPQLTGAWTSGQFAE